jgi:hypothetical protein
MMLGYQKRNKRGIKSSSCCGMHLRSFALRPTHCPRLYRHLLHPLQQTLRPTKVTPPPSARILQMDVTGTPFPPIFDAASYAANSASSQTVRRYSRSISYWQRVPATNDGVLGGFINVASSVG